LVATLGYGMIVLFVMVRCRQLITIGIDWLWVRSHCSQRYCWQLDELSVRPLAVQPCSSWIDVNLLQHDALNLTDIDAEWFIRPICSVAFDVVKLLMVIRDCVKLERVVSWWRQRGFCLTHYARLRRDLRRNTRASVCRARRSLSVSAASSYYWLADRSSSQLYTLIKRAAGTREAWLNCC